MQHVQRVEHTHTDQHLSCAQQLLVTSPLHLGHDVRVLLEHSPVHLGPLAALRGTQHLPPVLGRQPEHAEGGECLGQRVRPDLLRAQADRGGHVHHAPAIRPPGLDRHVPTGFERRTHQRWVSPPAVRPHEPPGRRVQRVLPFLTGPGRATRELHQPLRRRTLQGPHQGLAHGDHRRFWHPGRPRRPGLGEPRQHSQPPVPPLPKMPGQRRRTLHHQRIDRVHHRPPATPQPPPSMTRQQAHPPPALQLAWRHHHLPRGKFTHHLQISRTRRPSCHAHHYNPEKRNFLPSRDSGSLVPAPQPTPLKPAQTKDTPRCGRRTAGPPPPRPTSTVRPPPPRGGDSSPQRSSPEPSVISGPFWPASQ